MPSRTSPKDFFLHLFSTIILYTVVGSLIDLSFTIVNRLFPDTLSNYFSAGSLIWPISMLIVLTPLLYLFEHLITRDIVAMPEKRDIWIRRWRIFLTLFLNVATIAGDLIALINTYLNGEISTRFILKVLIVFIISAIVFAYYYLSLKDSSVRTKVWRQTLSWLGIAVILTGIVGGFVIVGSPSKQRAMRFDEQRISDLSSIQYQITYYYQRKGHLPGDLADLNDPLSSYRVPMDPETAKPYEYISENHDPLAFAVCATFDLAGDDNAMYGRVMPYPAELAGDVSSPSVSNAWAHNAGYTCFSRTIDPILYPQINK